MGRRLVTIATFDQPAQARLAQTALEDAGIQAAVSDESLVAMDWLLSAAVGGIKVQVWEEDADRAAGVLDDILGGADGGPEAVVGEDELAAEAEAAEPEDGGEPRSARAAAPPAPDDDPPSADPFSREECARRLFFTSWLALFAPTTVAFGCWGVLVYLPLFAYACYLLVKAAFGAGPLSGRGRFNLLVGGLLTFVGAPLFVVLALVILATSS